MTQPSAIAGTASLLLRQPGYVQGWQELIQVPTPAPGATFQRVIDGRWSERLYAAVFRITTSAVVANRFMSLQLLDNNAVRVTAIGASGGVPASTAVRANLCVTTPIVATGVGGDTYGNIPDVLAPPGWSWLLSVSGIDAGDQVDQVALLVHKFPSDITRINVAG